MLNKQWPKKQRRMKEFSIFSCACDSTVQSYSAGSEKIHHLSSAKDEQVAVLLCNVYAGVQSELDGGKWMSNGIKESRCSSVWLLGWVFGYGSGGDVAATVTV